MSLAHVFQDSIINNITTWNQRLIRHFSSMYTYGTKITTHHYHM